MQLRTAGDPGEAKAILNQLIDLARAEQENARRTIPLVEADSRLGWEPTMHYMTDAEHLKWKIEQVRRVIEEQLENMIALLDVSTY